MSDFVQNLTCYSCIFVSLYKILGGSRKFLGFFFILVAVVAVVAVAVAVDVVVVVVVVVDVVS